MGVAGERPWFDIKPPLGDPLLIFPRGYLPKYFPQGDTSRSLSGINTKTLKAYICQLISPTFSPYFEKFDISLNMRSTR